MRVSVRLEYVTCSLSRGSVRAYVRACVRACLCVCLYECVLILRIT